MWKPQLLKAATKLNGMSVLGIVWHYWIAPPLVAGGVLLVIATAFGYYKRVVHQRYPPESAVLESAKELGGREQDVGELPSAAEGDQ